MNLATAILLVILTGPSCSEYLQSLVCPYESRNVSMRSPRVWCKRDSQDENCCTGVVIQPGLSELEQSRIHVEDDGLSFTISVRELTQGDGVYWCGIMTEKGVILKLAEDYFTNSPLNFAWSILRWVLFLLLPLVSVSIHVYANKKDSKMV